MVLCLSFIATHTPHTPHYTPPPHTHTPHTHTGNSRGKIVIRVEEVQDSKFNIEMHLTATKLDKKDFFGKVRKRTT